MLIGLFLWALMDYIQSNRLKQIFYVQLLDRLSEQSMEYRLNFDRYIRSFHETAEIITKQSNFRDYFTAGTWSSENRINIKKYKRTPPWFPQPSTLRVLARPRYTLLIGPGGKVRETFSYRHGEQPPPSLMHPDKLILSKSLEQSLITRIGKDLLIITSEALHDSSGKTMVYLMLASPIDEEFINVSLGTIHKNHFVTLLTPGKEARILVSSDQAELPPGTHINDIVDRFLITGQEFYDYGSAEFIIKLASLISMSEVDKITEKVISTGRHQRNIIAPVFILTFMIITILVTRRINRLNSTMSDFSIRSLGTNEQKKEKGDQLHALENQFQRLTEDVIEARAVLQREAEEKTRLIVNNAFDAIITLDADGIITTWNPKAESIFGWSHEQAVGQKASGLILPWTGRESIDEAIKKCIETGEMSYFNKQIHMKALHKGKKEFPVEFTISPARLEGSYFFIAIIRDITEREKVEKALKESHERLLLVLDSLNSVVYVADMKTYEVLFINKYTRDVFGDIVGKVCWQALQAGQSGACDFCTNDRLLTPEGKPAGVYQWEFQNTINGKWYYIHDRAVYWIDGRIARIEIATDITDRKAAENKIRASLEEKEVLLKEIHHRVKNNMQVISSLLNLQSEYVKDSRYHEMFNESQNRIKSMALVHEKLYRSHDFANIDFRDYIGSLTKSLFLFYGPKAANITPVIEIYDINLSIDTAIPCGLILNELISNSLKHAFPDGRKGEIKVVLKKSDAEDYKYVLMVSDNGIGIPEELDIRKTKSLGLQLVTNLAEHQLHGRLELQRAGSTKITVYFNDIIYKKRV